jgi:AraC-like DNA-binding protein
VSSRPIESILSRLDRSDAKAVRTVDLSKPPDELNLIESAVVDLMERSQFYEDRHKEDLIYRQKSLFREAVSGENRWSEEEFRNHLGELGLPRSFELIGTAVVELDRYPAFEARYSLKDQYLFKFALRSAVKEIALERKLSVWEEWTSASQLSLLYVIQAGEDAAEDAITDASHQLTGWVRAHLPFTVTAAIGAAVDRHSLLPKALEETGEILQYKSVIGNGRAIGHWEVRQRKEASDVTLQHLQAIRQTIAAFKSGDAAWHDLFLTFFTKVKGAMATRDDLSAMAHFFVYSLHKEVMDLPAAYREYWNEHALVRLTEAVQIFDTVEDLQERMLEGLKAYEQQLAVLKQRGNPGLISEVKAYIELHYPNHELSLNHLSEAFNLSATYFSRLFKEEAGETFVSYLTQVRLEQARKLLLETEEPIQDIANRIGYLHAFSFIRVFKKAFGLTPGDYRKHAALQAKNSGSDG